MRREERQQCSAAVTQGKVGIAALNCHEISGKQEREGEGEPHNQPNQPDDDDELILGTKKGREVGWPMRRPSVSKDGRVIELGSYQVLY